jgi:hypothetical protein
MRGGFDGLGVQRKSWCWNLNLVLAFGEAFAESIFGGSGMLQDTAQFIGM